ncbi:hypothetical protein ALC53_00172 [Atta colombica]|uniref:Uncharacterized protein n=2 Tax=Atta colombica TaxID=520822 RepID=A0A195BZ80_9HYME|nr:hypothetical protein ALC53_00172 [Atta colombica]
MVTPTTPRKPYEEMKPCSNSLINTKRTINQYQKNIRSKNTKSYPPINEKCQMTIPISDSAELCDITAKILRQAMTQEEPRIHSRIKQLEILIKESHMNHKDLECKNSDK